MKNDKIVCSGCDKVVNKRNTCIIDEKPVCLFCIYGGTKPFAIYPIGKARTDLKPHETDGFSSDSKGISRIDLLPSQKRFMYKLDEEAFLTVVCYLHNVKSVKTVFKRLRWKTSRGLCLAHTEQTVKNRDSRCKTIEDQGNHPICGGS